MLKTKMCKFFLNGLCVVGEACRFAHSRHELKEATHVQQQRLPDWEHRRREFLGLGQGEGMLQPEALPNLALSAAATRALAQGTAMTTQQQQRQDQQQLQSIPPIPPVAQELRLHSLLEEEQLEEQLLEQLRLMDELEHDNLLELPEAAIPLPPRPFGERNQSSLSRSLRWGEGQESALCAKSWNGDGSTHADALHPQTMSSSMGVVEKLGDREHPKWDDASSIGGFGGYEDNDDAIDGEANATSVSGTGRVVIPRVSLDADVCQDVDTADAELVMARARGAWAFAGIGAVIVLQTKREAQARNKRISLDVEDLAELGTHCGSCELRRAVLDNAPGSPFLGPLPRSPFLAPSSFLGPLGGSLEHITQSFGGQEQPALCHRGLEPFGGQEQPAPCHRGRTRSALYEPRPDRSLPCAICPRSSAGGPCAACNCGLRIVQKNTFLTLDDDDCDTDSDAPSQVQGSRRRTRSL